MLRAVNADKTCFVVDGWIHAPLMIYDEPRFTSTAPTNKTSDNLYAYCSLKKIYHSAGLHKYWAKGRCGD
jgi:hypothetical protein